MNPIYKQFGRQQALNPHADIIARARQFRQNFQGDARAEVQRLLNSGQMSQAQFNQLNAIAQQIVLEMAEQ